ncbi:MAG: beta-glucosidase BglX [Bacteroidota bacterium]
MKFSITAVVITGAILAGGCVPPGTGDSGDAALDRKVDSVLSLMTLEEKLGQLTLYTSDWDVTGPTMREDYLEEIRSGRCGNIFNAHTVAYNRKLQRIAVEETRLGIPLLFGYDVVHGHRTIFPIPLGEACSWNLELMEKSARLAAREAAASGLTWTFAPVVDISRDPRWGRVSEGNGEDSYLGSLIAAARVRGFQGEDLSDPYTLAACIKHFAAYGAPVAGRDYNTVDMSEIAFRQDYLPPYQAGVAAGAVTVMASFNELFGVPASASPYLMTRILREEWGFKGFVVTDYTGIDELRLHGVAAGRRQAGILALRAGVDMDMQSAIYMENLQGALEDGGITPEETDRAVKRVLRVKFQLGLFDDPYRYLDDQRESSEVHSKEIMEHALQSARESVVLLKNEAFKGSPILPLASPRRIALIGPLADNQVDLLGSWHGAGDIGRVVTLRTGLEKKFPGATISYAHGCGFEGDDTSGFGEALRLARSSDMVVLAIGESQDRSGEAASRSEPGLPGVQEELALELVKTGTPVVVLIMAERPLVFPLLNEKAPAILYAWHPGTRGGDALAEILSGNYNPSGKLVMSIPRSVGQIPVYYNAKPTGRPMDPGNKFTSKYLDVPNSPLYPFGYGRSYTTFDYGPMELSSQSMGWNDTLVVRVTVRNTGTRAGEEVVQLYTRDVVGSLTRPLKELKGFQKIYLEPGASKVLQFRLAAGDLAFVNGKLERMAEAGEFRVMVGPDSEQLMEMTFTLNE